MNRAYIVKIHATLAAFIFPVALMFFITGSLYTWDVKGSYGSSSEIISLSAPLRPDRSALADLVKTRLQEMNQQEPSGEPGLKKLGTSFALEWTGSRKDVLLEPTANPLEARLTIKRTSWYRNLVQLHKAKGGVLFKIYAAIMAVSLIGLFISGFLLAWQLKAYRRLVGSAAITGLLSFVLAVAFS